MTNYSKCLAFPTLDFKIFPEEDAPRPPYSMSKYTDTIHNQYYFKILNYVVD